MNAEQAQTVEKVHAETHNREMEGNAQIARPIRGRPGLSLWLLGCLGGGGLLIAALFAWGYWEFGSMANTLAYANGERLLVDPKVLSFGAAPRGEQREVHMTIRNRTGKTVTILGAQSKCGCLRMEEDFPISLANGSQRELTIYVALTGEGSAFEKGVDFYTDDEAKPVIGVVVRGEIKD